jgi:hypothetical protein
MKKTLKLGFLRLMDTLLDGKLTLATDYHTGQPLAMLVHTGAYPDAKIFLETG